MQAPERTRIKVQDLLKGSQGLKRDAVEEARRAMIEAGEMPKGLSGETKKNIAVKPNVPEPKVEAKPEPVQKIEEVRQPEVVVAKPEPKQPQIERVETKEFVGELKQENGQWVGEIRYKNGAGTEKFTAPTQRALTLKILEGKGHASLKVRKVIREQKYGIETDKSYVFEGLTQEEYDSLPDRARQELLDKKAMEAAIAWKRDHPEYINTDENWRTIKKFLDVKELPYTYKNFDYAYSILTEDEQLELKEPVVVETPKSEDSAPVVVKETPAPAVVPEPAPVLQPRKRGTTGLQPGFSSVSLELDEPGDGNEPRELSEAELKALSPADHKRLYKESLKNKEHLIRRRF